MRVTSIRLQNYKSFVETGTIRLGPINVLVGRNNAGKSAVLRALLQLQQFRYVPPLGVDVRDGTESATTDIGLAHISARHGWDVAPTQTGTAHISLGRDSQPLIFLVTDDGDAKVAQIDGSEPTNFIVPFLGQRKVHQYQEDVRHEYAMQVGPDLQNLAAKLTRVAHPDSPGYATYARLCKELVGYVIRPISSQHGQRPGIYTDDAQSSPLYVDAMGDGVAQIVALLADLSLANDKLFLIEELENDLHPRALKALLDLILESSDRNQFVVTTHSNIVLRHLGAHQDASVYYVDADLAARPPAASIRQLTEREDRIAALRDLGYELNDFDLWDGWLFLEEASAERIIRDYLIPWFAPGLSQRVRTVSTRGNAGVRPSFEDFYRLVRYAHLEDQYKNRAWVVIDGDEKGQAIIKQLQRDFESWSPDRFRVLSEAQFEVYYPSRFDDAVHQTFAITDRRARGAAKRELLGEVRAWADADPAARSEFAESAAEVIDVLRDIEREISK